MTTNNTAARRAELRAAGLTSTTKFTFAAIVGGETLGTRTSGTMLYSHALIVGQTEADLGVLSWHLTEAAAVKAASAKYPVATWGVRRVVPVTVIKVTGKPAPGETMPNSDELVIDGKHRLAFDGPSTVPTDADRQAAYDKAMAEAPAAPAVDRAQAIAARLNAAAAAVVTDPDVTLSDADAADMTAAALGDADSTAPAAVRQMFKGLGWSVTEPVSADAVDLDVDVVEPIVTVTTEGEIGPAEGRPINKRTRENMAACQAVGLAYWSEHPKPSHVWAVDTAQQPHPVRIDRKRNLAIIAEPNDAIGGNPLRSWSIDPAAQAVLIDAAAIGEQIAADKVAALNGRPLVDTTGLDLTTSGDEAALAQAVADGSVSFESAVLGALGDRLIVGHIGGGPVTDKVAALAVESLTAPRLGNLEAVNHAITAQTAAEPVITDAADAVPATLSVTARKQLLAAMVGDALGKMIADLSSDQRDALAMTDDQVTAQIKAWLRRSGRAMIYGDGKGVTGDTDAD